jgi:hypothetical protein
MSTQNGFLTEFLTEVNFVLTQEDYGNKLQDLLSPIRNLFLEPKELLSFSLARYCGANTRIAFFSEWYFQVVNLTRDSSRLLEADRDYFRHKVPLKLRGLPNLHDLVDEHIKNIFLPHQIAVLHTKNKEFIDDLVYKYPYLNKYLSKNFLSQFVAGELTSVNKLYNPDLNLSAYLEAQGRRMNFVQIGLPVLLGLSYTFNQPHNPVNPQAVKWVLLEELLHQVATLYQINSTKDLQKFIYHQGLSEKEEFDWLQLDEHKQFQQALASAPAREEAKTQAEKIYDSAHNNLQALVFPEEYKTMLNDLIEWAYEANN